MGQAYSGGASVLLNTSIKRRRELPIPGVISVRVGDHVESETIIGSAKISGEGVLVRIAEEIGLSSEEAISTLTVNIGDAVRKGDIVARHRAFFGLFRAEVSTPVDGTIELISGVTGTIMVRCPPTEVQKKAFLAGTISEIQDGIGVTVSAVCTVIQGVFGVGGERSGKLVVLEEDGALSSLPPREDLAGAVIVSRGSPSLGALLEGANRGIAGWVAGSVEDHVIESYAERRFGVAITGDEAVPFTFFITEGFGSIPMSDQAFFALKQHEGQGASISGITQVRAGAIRPEAIISLGAAISITEPIDEVNLKEHSPGLAVGRSVRLIRHPFFGQVGRVHELPPYPRIIATGASARVVVVELAHPPHFKTECSEQIFVEVPRANVELLAENLQNK
jgi:hypothetical protein